MEAVISNIKVCGDYLDSWNKQSRRNLTDLIVSKKRELRFEYNNIRNGSWRKIQMLESQLDRVLETKEQYWRQRSRIEWL